MKKGFFISIDLVLTLVLVIFLFGILGVYFHNTINETINYKKNVELSTNMNVALNKIAYGDCNLIGSNNRIIKPLGFCIFENGKLNRTIFKDLNASFIKPIAKDNYIMKTIKVYVSDDGNVSKKDYLDCLSNTCNNFMDVNVYVWQ